MKKNNFLFRSCQLAIIWAFALCVVFTSNAQCDPPVEFCPNLGESFSLTPPTIFPDGAWFDADGNNLGTGDATGTLTVTTPGSYLYTGTDQNACPVETCCPIELVQPCSCFEPIEICSNLGEVVDITPPVVLTGGEWFDANGVSLGAGDANGLITISSAGIYTYSGADPNSCPVETCCPIEVIEICCADGADKDGDGVANGDGAGGGDLDSDNDGIPDIDEDGVLIPGNCSTPDLTALEGSPAANTTLAGVTIGGATITLTTTFTGGATQDEDIINNSQTTGDLGIRQGVANSPDATDQMINTYTFNQPVCNLRMTVWDIDRTDLLTVQGSNGGVPVTMTVINPGALLDSVTGSGTTLITADEDGNLQDPGGTDYGFVVVFDGCVDEVVYTFNNEGDINNTGGSYSVTFNEGCGQPVANADVDGDGVPNSLDLDSDNDGIPDAIEACGDISLILEDCSLDFNGDGAYNLGPDGCPNGLLLNVCTTAPIDSDGDGTPDYLDLDSDNDGCADAVEAASNTNPNVNEDTFNNPAVDICGLVLAGTFAPCQVPVTTSWLDPTQDSCESCPTDGPDKDRDGVPDRVDIDDDNDGILDVDEGCVTEPDFCSTPDLASLDGTATNGLGVLTTSNLTIGNATITGTRLFGGTAVLDEDEINTSQTGAEVAIRQGLSASSGPADFVENTYSFSEPVCNLEMQVWDIDRTDELTITANGPNGPVAMTLSSIGPELGNDPGDIVAGSGTTAINIVETGNLQYTSGLDYAFIVTFDDCVDDVVFTFWNNTDGNNTGGSYSLGFNEGCTLPDDCVGVDTDGDGFPDHLDNDSDNDGIPDAIEACGDITLILERCMLDNDNNAIYPDADGDGCRDGLVSTACATAPIDSDGDGIPDFRDLDSDGDGCSDSTESGSEDGNPGVNDLTFADPAAPVDACGLVILNGDPTCFSPPDEIWIDPTFSGCCEEVAGVVFFDNNNDGCQETPNEGVPNVTVELLACNADGSTTSVATATTGADGSYLFNQTVEGGEVCLDPDLTYQTQISNLPAGFVNSTGDADANADGASDCPGDDDDSPANDGLSACYDPKDDDATDGDGDQNIDFGIFPCQHIAGVVFEDSNNDGCQADAADGVPGVTVELAVCNPDGTTTVLGSTTTGADGSYEFGPDAGPDNLCLDPALTYQTQISNTPPGFQNSTGDASAGCAGDEDDSPGNDGVSECYNPSDDDAGDGDGDENIDFGIYPCESVAGVVFEDSDNDGCQADAADGVPGVTVELLACNADGSTTPVSSTTTGADGSYEFGPDAGPDNVCLDPAVTYQTQISNLPPGFDNSTGDASAGCAGDEDDSPGNDGVSACYNPSDDDAGDSDGDQNIDFGIYCNVDPGTLTGTFEFCVTDGIPDLIPTGTIDPVFSGSVATFNQWVITDTNGVILDLPADIYAVNFEGTDLGTCLIWNLAFEDGLAGGVIGNTAPTDLDGCFALSNPLEVVRIDCCQQVAGVVFYDNNNDGCQADAADGVPNVTVALLACNADGTTTPVTTTTTGADGSYVFGPTPEGGNVCLLPDVTYQTQISNTPPGFQNSTGDASAGCVGDEDDSPGNDGVSECYNPSDDDAGDGDGDENIDFGIYPCESVSGVVFEDSNNDGCQADAADGVPGVTVELAVCNPDGTTTVLGSTTTGADGSYEFGPDAGPDNLC